MFLVNFWRVYLTFNKKIEPIWALFYVIEQILIVANGRILINSCSHLVTLDSHPK